MPAPGAKPVRHERYASVDLEYLSKNPDNPNLRGSYKQWWITVYDDGSTLVQFGKVSGTEPTGRSEKDHGSVEAANRFADRKIKEKMTPETNPHTGMVTKYTRVDIEGTGDSTQSRVVTSGTELAQVAREQIAKGDPIVSELVSRLARENVHNIMAATAGGGMTYDDTRGVFSTPMGVVKQTTIDVARPMLTTIATLVTQHRHSDPEYIEAVQSYLRLVPMDLGHTRTTLDRVFPDVNSVLKQNDVLDALEASLRMLADRAVSDTVDDGVKRVEPPRIFEVTLEPIDSPKDVERFRAMYRNARSPHHESSQLDVRRVFRVDIPSMRSAYELAAPRVGNEAMMYHGSKTSNLLSILRSGLVIPPASADHVCGSLFGRGVYTAPCPSKSLNYSLGYWNGRGRDYNCFVFLTNILMGRPHFPKSQSDGPFPKPGFDSVHARAGIRYSNGTLMNDEIVVYNTDQVNLVYLLEFSRGGR